MFIKAILTYGVVLATLTFNSGQTDLTGVKCVVQGERAAIQATAVDYKNGKVYLCCDRSADAFKKDVELEADAKFTIKANHQLVLTGQYVQNSCPLTGDTVDENLSSTVGAVKIGFSSAESQAKIDRLKNIEEKVALLFSDAAFDMAFSPKKVQADLIDAKKVTTPETEVSGKADATEGDEKSELVAERQVENSSTKK